MDMKNIRRPTSTGPSILNDIEIHQLCEGPVPMISPFVAQQVRKADDDSKIISYGLSSFGYDIRCADEFHVFTNINHTVIDPKNFDSNCFVRVSGQGYCIIPPNSFALSRTVEHFHIPRDVVTVCVGKSTYARCFSGDTRVALVDGRSLTLKEMAKRAKTGERFFGYTILSDGSIGVEELVKPRKTAKDQALVAVELDNGEVIKCTPDHKFMLRNGLYRRADRLQADDSLMPLNRYVSRGYEMVYCPKRTRLEPTHRLADAWSVDYRVYEAEKGTHRHHLDHNKRNNDPRNICRVDANWHIKHHNDENSDPDYMEFHTARIKEGMRDYIENHWDEFVASNRQKFVDFWTLPKYAQKRRKMLKERKALWQQPYMKAAQSVRMKKAWRKNPEAFTRHSGEDHHNFREDLTDKLVAKTLREYGSVSKAADALGASKNLIYRRFPDVIERLQRKGHLPVNHKVVSVRPLRERQDVYCVTVPESHNFALESGVFVHNCGLVVNVTPFEPEWSGYVTLEFSNTTPLPAKIYANEGCAQVLFFRGTPCRTSYADRSGKYQHQYGITLPRS